MGNSGGFVEMVVGLGRASLPTKSGLGADGPERDADLTLIAFGGLCLESGFQMEPPQFKLKGCVDPLAAEIAAAQAVVSPDGVVGWDVVGDSAPPPRTEYVRERF